MKPTAKQAMVKTIKVIQSCQTTEHLRVAKRMLDRCVDMVETIDDVELAWLVTDAMRTKTYSITGDSKK